MTIDDGVTRRTGDRWARTNNWYGCGDACVRHQKNCKPAGTLHAHGGVQVCPVCCPRISLALNGMRFPPSIVAHPVFTQASTQSNHGPSLSKSFPGLSILRFVCRSRASRLELRIWSVIRRRMFRYAPRFLPCAVAPHLPSLFRPLTPISEKGVHFRYQDA